MASDMSGRTSITVSKETHRELRIAKAKADCDSFDTFFREYVLDNDNSTR